MPYEQLGHALRHLFSRIVATQAGDASDALLLDLFARKKDEGAFEALVRRHGPMVFAVCRRMLKNDHDAEDAFQATFLVLVRKIDSIRRSTPLANWLYGVACKTAKKARTRSWRTAAVGRLTSDMENLAMSNSESLSNLELEELKSFLDDELHRLPDKYRAPIILCYLQGKNKEQAARILGWPEGTVSGRLARGREMLRRRLGRRGVTLLAGAFATALSQSAVQAVVPSALVSSTAKAAALMAAGGAVAAAISTPVTTLTQGVLKTMFLTKIKIAAAIILAVGTITTGAGIATYRMVAAGMHTRATQEGVHSIADNSRSPVEPQMLVGKVLQAIKDVGDPQKKATLFLLLAKAQLKLGAQTDAMQTLRQALDSTRSIPHSPQTEGRKFHLAHRIAEAQADMGQVEDTLHTAAAVKDPGFESYRNSIIGIAAGALARQGKTKEAFQTADTIKDDVRRSDAIGRIAGEQAKAGKIKDALQAADRVRGTSGADLALHRIAVVQAQSGEINGALRTADAIRFEKASALAGIARIQAERGDLAGARQTIELARQAAGSNPIPVSGSHPLTTTDFDLRHVALAQVAIGDVKEAMRTAGSITSGKDLTESKEMILLEALLKAGDFQAAELVADMLGWQKSYGLYRVATAQAAAKNLQAARQMATRITQETLRIQALSEIARFAAKAGDGPGASRTFQEALRLAETIQVGRPGADFDPDPLFAVAAAQAEVGQEKDALAWAVKQPPDLQAWAILGVIDGLLNRKEARKQPSRGI